MSSRLAKNWDGLRVAAAGFIYYIKLGFFKVIESIGGYYTITEYMVGQPSRG